MITRKQNTVYVKVGEERVIWFDLRDNIKGKARNKIDYMVWAKTWKASTSGPEYFVLLENRRGAIE